MKNHYILTLIAIFLLFSCHELRAKEMLMDNIPNITWYGKENPSFQEDLKEALNRLDQFLLKEGWGELDKNLTKEVRHFETKELFDEFMIENSNGQLTSVPRGFIGLGDQRVLSVVSFEAFKEIYDEQDHEDYINVLVHESAHIFHSDLVGDDQMGPMWFFEGLAIVAANQYLNAPELSKEEMKEVVLENERGSYEKYAAIIRKYLEKFSLKEMVEKACLDEQEFLSWLGE